MSENMNYTYTNYYNSLQQMDCSNKYIYVKPVQPILPKASSVLINPHFHDKVSKVFVNPNFQSATSYRAKIHVNPNIIRSFSAQNSNLNNAMLSSIPSSGQNLTAKPEINSSQTAIKTDLVPKPSKICLKNANIDRKTIISTRTKLVRAPVTVKTPSPQKIIQTRHKIVRKPSNSVLLNQSLSSFKLIETKTTPSKTYSNKSLNGGSKSVRKKYVFINKHPSSTFIASNVILKHKKWQQSSLININGILYKKSTNSLKKSTLTSKTVPDKPQNKIIRKTKYKLIQSKTLLTPRVALSLNSSSVPKKYKLVKKTLLISPSKLKKSNVMCPIFRKYGRCNGKENGTCIKKHNPKQVVLCTRFLQGACLRKNCPLSHQVSQEKMPTCKYYLEGLCTRDDCPYLHVKINPKADICKDFIEGFCELAEKCNKRHQYLCPDFEKFKKCPRKRCSYPHVNVSTNTPKKILKSRSSKKMVKKAVVRKERTDVKEKIANIRYYDENKNVNESIEDLVEGLPEFHKRPKLGSLPSFIPFDKEI